MQKKNKHIKHELSDLSLVTITKVLEMSLKDRTMLTIELYDPIEQLQVTGLVDQIDYQSGLFWVNGDSFILADIEGVELHDADIKGKV